MLYRRERIAGLHGPIVVGLLQAVEDIVDLGSGKLWVTDFLLLYIPDRIASSGNTLSLLILNNLFHSTIR